MLPDRVSNPGPLTYESDALPIELRGPANPHVNSYGAFSLFFFTKSYKPKGNFWQSKFR